MATGPWDSFKQAEPSEPQEQGPWAQFAEEKPVSGGAPWEQFQGESGFVPSIMRGGRGMASLATDVIPAMVGKALGKDEYAKQQMEEAAAYQKETERMYPAQVASYKDIQGVGDALTYVKEAIGEAIPSLIPSLFTGGAAGFAVRGATTAAMEAAEQVAAREVAKAAAKNVLTQETIDGIRQAAIDAGVKQASRIALKAEAGGALAGSAVQNIPDVYQNIYEATGQQDLGAALAFGSFNAALDAVTPINLLRKANKAGIRPEEIAAAWYKRAGKGAVEGLVTEGGTEALQEMSSAAAEKFVDNNQQFFSEKNFERFVNAGLKGGAGGAGITSATNVAFGKGPEKAQPTPTAVEQPAEAPTQAQPLEARVQQRAQELEGQGYMKEDAAAIAVKNIADEDAKARGPELNTAVADVTPDAERVQELTTQFKEQFNLSQEEAQSTAVELATEEAKEDAIAQREATGEADVGQPIAEAGGVSPELVGQPDQVEPTGGAVGPATDGVVPAGTDVVPTPEGARVEPVALTEEPTPEAAPAPETELAPAPAPAVVEEEAAPAPTEVLEEETAPQTEQAAVQEAVTEEAKRLGRPPNPAEVQEAKKAALKKYRAEYTKAARQFNQNKGNMVSQLEEASKPLDEGEFENEAAYEQALEDQRAEKADAIKRLVGLESQFRGTPIGKKAKALLSDTTKVTPEELAKVKRGIEVRKAEQGEQLKEWMGRTQNTSALANRGAVAKADARFSKATNGAQALAVIIKTGTPFQKLLAQRLRSAVATVKFQVIEKGDPTPEALQSGANAEAWDRANGVYLTKQNVVYVRGASFGDGQGANNITVLHELLHAATNAKIKLGLLANFRGFDTDAKVTRFTRELRSLMVDAQMYYEYMLQNGMVSKELKERVDSTNSLDEATGEVGPDIFELPQEFLAYGMSDPIFQQFLNRLPGKQKDTNGFSRFVQSILDLFGLGKERFSALSDLINVSDKLLNARKTSTMELVEKGMPDEEEISASAKQNVEKTDATVAKLEKSSFADNIRDNVPLATSLRDKNKIADVLAVNTKNWSLNALRQLLPALQTETIVQWADRVQVGNERGIPGIKESWKATGDMLAMRNKLTNAMGDMNQKLTKVAQKDPAQYRKLADVMHFSTLISKDPSTNKTNSALNRMWGELSAENQKLYEQVRDFYKNNHELYHHLLDEQIANSNMEPEAKGKLIAQIKKMYEDGKKLYPYFPLMRYGQFWVRVGKGKDGEFHMFESAKDRDYFVLERVRQMNAAGDKRSKAEMMKDLDLDEGNDLSNARRNDTSASDMLKQIFNSIDAAEKNGTVEAESLKDEIYQLYLQTLPDRNFRRQYLKRQGKAGFSGDIQRNFINSGLNVANQLSRIKYGPKIMGELDRAQNSLEGNPDKARLGEFVSEMRLRAEQQVRPDPESGAWFAAAKLANTSAFLWMMTSIKTMVAQFTAIPVFVGPVLGSKYGEGKAALALGKSLNVFNGLGIKDKDGNFAPPSMANLKDLTADEKLAAQYMHDRGISDTTLAFDLGNRRDIPTAVYNGKARQMFRQIPQAMTALFHHAERMIREVTFMSSYRLNRGMGKTHEASLMQAEADTHEALNNYHASNRPRGLVADSERRVMLDAHKPLGRAVLQFKMFPAFVTTYFVRNFYRMTRDMDPDVRTEARKQFIGSLGMSFALAGYVGVPGVSFAMGILQGLLNMLRGEDDDDELEKRNLEFWFRNKWMPETFGNVKIGDRNLAELLDRGLITSLTGYDITSSLSMNNMWIPEQKDQATLTGEVQSLFVSMMGPGASLAFTQIPKGIDYFNQGKILQGMEQWAPALFRGSLTAERYRREGATTSAGAVIKDKDEFTTGQLLAQSAGFVTEGLQARREAIFALQGEILKVRQERTSLLNRLDNEINTGSDDAVEAAFDKIIRFNSRNPMDAIDADNINQSMQKHMKRRFNSDRGFPLDAKYYPFVMDLLEPSGVKLDREEKAARK